MAGAALLMATSAIGPGFLTQTAVFTEKLRADFAFAILVSILVDLAVQANVWRVLGVARRRGQELASELVPGLGTALALLVAMGGLAFNVGNVAGCGLGLAVLGIPAPVGATLSAAAAILLVTQPRASHAMDTFATAMGILMIVMTAGVMISSRPDYLVALERSVAPGRIDLLPIVTLVGGTVGGYITFSGVHRLLQAGVGGASDVGRLDRAATLGILVTGAMRVILFLAILGVLGRGAGLDTDNPTASAFRLGAGEWGYRAFGFVLWSAAITSVVGCSYTTLSFVQGLWTPLQGRGREAVTAFVGVSLVIHLLVGRPVRLLIFAGALNGLILPATLGVILIACRRRELMAGYRHPPLLQAVGWIAWVVSVVAGFLAVKDVVKLVAGA